MRRSIVLAGSLAQRPCNGGHTWVFLQYLLGFRRLGWDVLFLDELQDGMCTDQHGQPCPFEQPCNLQYFLAVMRRFGLDGSFALLHDRGGQSVGVPKSRVIDHVRHAALFINVMGYVTDETILAAAPTRVFLDIDPGFGQMWRELGLANVFRGHDAYVTVGENIGQADCEIPTCGLPWITTRPPVVLKCWPATAAPADAAFTSVASWRGPFGSIEYAGKTYGLRVHEFRKFAALPRLTGLPFRLAVDIHPAETNDLAMLHANQWTLDDPAQAARDPLAYRSYLPAIAGRIHGRQEHVRATAQRLVQRPQRVLSGQRQAGHRPEHRFRSLLPDRGGIARFQHGGGGLRRRRRRGGPLRTSRLRRPGPSLRSISIRIACCAGCFATSASIRRDTRHENDSCRRRPGEQAAQRR